MFRWLVMFDGSFFGGIWDVLYLVETRGSMMNQMNAAARNK